jgi:hypothetical protein
MRLNQPIPLPTPMLRYAASSFDAAPAPFDTPLRGYSGCGAYPACWSFLGHPDLKLES